ncbi:hypothetical protein [Lysobacter gummosus]|uniref:hypothetical protein n=1 Tax=Lysobacter gummosus TaxID=262324 RepID=UPI00362EB281
MRRANVCRRASGFLLDGGDRNIRKRVFAFRYDGRWFFVARVQGTMPGRNRSPVPGRRRPA